MDGGSAVCVGDCGHPCNADEDAFVPNFTEAATVTGFYYDVKNARLCQVFEGQGLTHREPALDEQDFERYVKSILPLMLPQRDVLWVLGAAQIQTGRS